MKEKDFTKFSTDLIDELAKDGVRNEKISALLGLSRHSLPKRKVRGGGITSLSTDELTKIVSYAMQRPLRSKVIDEFFDRGPAVAEQVQKEVQSLALDGPRTKKGKVYPKNQPRGEEWRRGYQAGYHAAKKGDTHHESPSDR